MGRKSKLKIEEDLKNEKRRSNIKKLKEIANTIRCEISFMKDTTFEDCEDSSVGYCRSFDREIEVEKSMIEIIFETNFIEKLSNYCNFILDNNGDNLTGEQKYNIENIFNGMLEKDALENPVDYLYFILFNK